MAEKNHGKRKVTEARNQRLTTVYLGDQIIIFDGRTSGTKFNGISPL